MKFLYKILFLSLLLTSCGSKKRNAMQTFTVDPDNPPISEVQVPIRIDIQTIQRDLNLQLGDILFEDEQADGDDLHIRATKQNDIVLEVIENGIEYSVPMDIWMKKPYRLADIEGNGEIEVRLRTTFDVDSDWDFVTSTRVLEHQWLSKPKVKVGFVQLPIEGIADNVLEKSKELIEQAIDDQIAQQLNLESEMDKVWEQLYQPFSLSDEYATWMLLNPVSIGMTPLESTKDSWNATLVLQATPELYIGQEPDYQRPTNLPTFRWVNEVNKGFAILLRTEVPYDHAEELAKASLVGQTFTQGSRSVTVSDIKIYGKGNLIGVETFLEGSFNGSVELLMKPKYVKREEQFEINLEKVDVRTGNILYKSLAWLFKGKIEKTINEQIEQALNDNLEIIRETVQGQIQSQDLGNDIKLKGDLSQLEVRLALVKADYLEIWVELNGDLGVEFGAALNED